MRVIMALHTTTIYQHYHFRFMLTWPSVLQSPQIRTRPWKESLQHIHMWRRLTSQMLFLRTINAKTTSCSSKETTTTNHLMALFSGTTQVSQYQKGKTSLDFTEARDSEWQWHQLGHMQVCTLLQTDNHASTPPLSFLQARCPSCHPTDSVKALKA